MKGKKSNKSIKTVMLFAALLVMVVFMIVGCGPKAAPTSSEGSASNVSSSAGTENASGDNKGGTVAKVNDTTIDQNQCSECHEIWPEIATWQTSVHAKVDCLVCHKDYNPSQNKAAHDSKSFQKPIALRNTTVTDEACKSCHAMENRNETLLPDLIAPHSKHAAAKVSCLECHRFTTHGNIAERKVTTRAEFADYNEWSPQMAKKAAPGVQRRPNMFVCIKCHESRNVTTKCSACHYWPDRASLPSHENPEWGSVHGKVGRQDVDNCAKCHYDKESKKFATPSTGDKIADFARANSYCYGCHLKRPTNHDSQWMGKHPQMAGEKGLPNCFACHDRNQPGANVTGTYCNTCHWFQEPAAPKPEAAEEKKE